jgi:protein-tyrosine sulfotransferase
MQLDDERYKYIRLSRPDFWMRRLFRRPTLDRALYADSNITAGDRAAIADVVLSSQRRFQDRRLLFIFGTMPRSGTNFLFELLLRAPPFERSHIGFAELPILAGEDYFRGPTDLIGRVHRPSADAFGRMEWMAYAVSGFRNRVLDIASPGSVTLIKNPVTWNIELWPVFFPQDRTLFIVRDCRYVVDSFVRTFARRRLSRTFEDICIETALAVEKSLAFIASQPKERLLLLRYEDVVSDKAGTVSEVLAWMGCDPGRCRAEALEDVAVYGSSTHSPRHPGGRVDWTPVAVDATFDPVNRNLDWPSSWRRVFDRHCGALNERLGYPSA